MRIGIAAIVLSCAFGVSASPSPSHASSGSRITVIRESLVGADGSATASTEHFRDEVLNVDCSFQPASDGVARCLPSTEQSAQLGAAYGQDPFADASCTTPLAMLGVGVSGKCLNPTYAIQSNHVFPVVEEYARTRPFFGKWTYGGDRCLEAVRVPGQRAFTVGAEIAPTTFAERTTAVSDGPVSEATGGTRIKIAKEQSGANRAAATTRYIDEKLNTECYIDVASDGVMRCLPPSDAGFGGFADASCTTPVAAAFGNGHYTHTAAWTTDGCGKTTNLRAIFPVTGEWTGPVFGKLSGKCVEGKTLPAKYKYFTLGAEMAPTDFVAFTPRGSGSPSTNGSARRPSR